MIDPNQLLNVAAELAESPARGRPRQAPLRRAISTAYYALFHRLVTGASDLLAGGPARGTRRYRLIYRSFEHRRMVDVCRQIVTGTLRTEAGERFHGTIHECATAFIDLQESRHEADYDPFVHVALSDARTAVARAGAAIQMLGNSLEDQQDDFFTLLHFKHRP